MYDKLKTCCFTGHRPQSFPWKKNGRLQKALCIRIGEAIDRAIERGFTHFIAGNALGVDTWAAQLVLERKKSNPSITLEIALPFEGHNSNVFSPIDKKALEDIHANADIVHVVTKSESHTKAFKERDEYMVDNSSLLIAVYDDEWDIKGGTYRTLQYGKKRGIEIDQIAWGDIGCEFDLPDKYQHWHTFEIIVSKAELEQQLDENFAQDNLLKLIVGGKDSPDYKKLLTMVALKFQFIGSLTYRVLCKPEERTRHHRYKAEKASVHKYKRFLEGYCASEREIAFRLFPQDEKLTKEQKEQTKRCYAKYHAVKYYCVPYLSAVGENYGADWYAAMIDYIMSTDDIPLKENAFCDNYVVKNMNYKNSNHLLFDPWDMKY